MGDEQVQISDLSEQFAYKSLEIFDAECRNDYASIAQFQGDMTLLYCKFRALGDEGNAALMDLTMHEVAEVRVCAAIYYIWVDLAHSLDVLCSVAANWAHDMRPEERAVAGRARLVSSVGSAAIHICDPYSPSEELSDGVIYGHFANSQQANSLVVLH